MSLPPFPWMHLPPAGEERSNPSITLSDLLAQMSYGGHQYQLMPSQTLGGKMEEIDESWVGYVQGAYKANGVVFACVLARMALFSEARFQFRRIVNGRPGELFGTTALDVVDKPWPGGTTGDMLARALQDADLAGNWFGVRRRGGIRRLRPDWMTIVAGSPSQEAGGEWAIDAELVGYLYHPGGHQSKFDPIPLLPMEVAHFAPIPDPQFRFRGMSWVTPVIREVMADGAATEHKLRFFENGATPNMVVTLDAAITPDNFQKWVDIFAAKHDGLENAYRTMYLGGGADVKVVGADLKQLDFKITQGGGETRVAAAAGVPPVIVGLSEGLQAATYSNYAQARRRFADGTMRPLWRNFAGSLQQIIETPVGAQLWYDDRDIPALQEDQKDAAEIQSIEATTMEALIRAGFKPEDVVKAVTSGDLSTLQHTGLVSVQLMTPGESALSNGASNGVPDLIPAGN